MERVGTFGTALAIVTLLTATSHARPTPQQKCAVAKNTAAAKKIGAKLKCWQKAVAAGATAADPTCLMTAEAKFAAAMTKAEADNGCIVTGDANTIEGFVDNCVSTVVALTPSVACQTANLTCKCGIVTVSFFAPCGAPSAQSCATIRNFAAQSCIGGNQSPDGCLAAQCTDACTGQQCG